jgi:sugar-specific transcriptional regulator TrmB
MSDQSDTFIAILKPYGLTDDEALVYLYLIKNSATTALLLSRSLRIARTRVYRILDKLLKKQLVVEKLGDRGLFFEACPPSRLEQLAKEKELEAKTMRDTLPTLVSQLEQLLPQKTPSSKVLYYEGIEGLKQVSYNILNTKDTLRVFEMEHLSDFLPYDFSETVRKKLVEQKITTLDLTNKSSFPGFTDVTTLIEVYNKFRYIDSEKLKIQFEVLIYNNVYATYTYTQDTIFCVEIYNEQLASMQKQLFDFIWQQATPMRFTDQRGAATI